MRYAVVPVIIMIAVVTPTRVMLAQSATNSPPTATERAEACDRRLHEILDALAAMQEKVSSNQTAVLDCIRARAVKVQGLVQLTQQTLAEMRKPLKVDEPGALESLANSVKTSCARAEGLLAEAQGCVTSPLLKNALPHEKSAEGANAAGKIAPRDQVYLINPPVAVRTEQTCLHHEQFAAMMVRAMDVRLDRRATPDECVAALSKLAVEPLGGWQSGKCATVDDVYVVCARAMNLKVRDPQDPLSYGQALRDEGLGVDTLLPERDPQLDPPYVVDSEVRKFLRAGYAAPLPSSVPIAPN